VGASLLWLGGSGVEEIGGFVSSHGAMGAQRWLKAVMLTCVDRQAALCQCPNSEPSHLGCEKSHLSFKMEDLTLKIEL